MTDRDPAVTGGTDQRALVGASALEPIPDTMTAAVYDRYGPPERVVRVDVVPVPAVGAGDVLVRVAAASVNALDWHYVTGLPIFARPTLGLRRPNRRIPGADIAGTIVAVGPGVDAFAIGDEVFGQVDGGGYAEYAATPADWVVAKSGGMAFEEAATLGVAAETALQGLRDWGALQPGHRVLVNGASGGVGTFAVQLAKALGAEHVTAVCSTGNVETARRLGADRVVDYTAEDATVGDRRYNLIFDNAGTWPLRTCRRLLAEQGTYVAVTAPKSRWVKPLPRILTGMVYFRATGERATIGKVARRSTPDLELLRDLVYQGQLRPVMDRRYALADAAEALRVQGEFHSQGKSVVIP